MRISLLLFISVLSFTSCKQDKDAVEFKSMINLDLGNLSKENAKLNATAVFINNSDQEYDLKDLVLDFSVDGKDLGTVVTKISKKIQPKAEFSIPVRYTFETNSIIEEGHEPSATYSVLLSGDLTLVNTNGEEVVTSVKYATSYEFLTKKEERLEKRDERKKRREEKKAAKNDGE